MDGVEGDRVGAGGGMEESFCGRALEAESLRGWWVVDGPLAQSGLSSDAPEDLRDRYGEGERR